VDHSALDVARAAARQGHLDGIKYILEAAPEVVESGELLEQAARGGSMPCLTFLSEAGCKWTGMEAVNAAFLADPVVLRYCLQHRLPRSWDLAMHDVISSRSPECMQLLYDHGYNVDRWCVALWGRTPAEGAIDFDSLECLKCAHEHERKVSLGQTGGKNPNARGLRWRSAPWAKSLPVLRYVHEHMDPAFARTVLSATAHALDDRARRSKLPYEETDGQMVLYLERHLGRRLPPSLRALAASRRERRVAFAQALYRAKRQAAQHPHHPSHMLWSAMEALPSELRMRIAVEAELVSPDVLVKAAGPGAVVRAGR
jgi:hypothetical protein